MSRTLVVTDPTQLHLTLDVKTYDSIELCPDTHLTRGQADILAVLRRRIADRLRKQKSRDNTPDAISLPLPAGTRAALGRVMEAAGFDDPRDFLAYQIHRLDALLKCDGHKFNEQAIRTVTVGDLEKYYEQLQSAPVQRSDDV